MSTDQATALNHVKSMAITYGVDTPEIDASLPRPFIQEGDPVIFVYTRDMATPGTVTAVHEDNSVDLTALIPGTGWKIVNKLKVGGQLERHRRMVLDKRNYQGVRYLDPLIIIDKVAVPLSAEQQASVNPSDSHQTMTDIWVQGKKRRRLPEMQRLVPGTWFQASPFQWRIYCWKAMEKDKYFTSPEEEKWYPKEGAYTDYREAFEKYFKQYKKLADRWHRVEMRAEKRVV